MRPNGPGTADRAWLICAGLAAAKQNQERAARAAGGCARDGCVA